MHRSQGAAFSSSSSSSSSTTTMPSSSSVANAGVASVVRPALFSKPSFEMVLASLAREREELRTECDALERQERAAAERLPALQQQHQSLILTSRKAQEELGIVRRQEKMLLDQQKQSQKRMEDDRRAMEELTHEEARLEQEHSQKKRNFVKEMEKKSERLAHSVISEQDYVWRKLMMAETAELLWNKAQEILGLLHDDNDDHNNNNNVDSDNDDKRVLQKLESAVEHMKRAWTQFTLMADTDDYLLDQKRQIRSFVLEQSMATEESLLEMEELWATKRGENHHHDHHHPTQQHTQDESDGDDDGNSSYRSHDTDEDRRLMPPPPPPAHMQLFYGRASSSSQSESQSPPLPLTDVAAAGLNTNTNSTMA